jgi:MORN repeat
MQFHVPFVAGMTCAVIVGTSVAMIGAAFAQTIPPSDRPTGWIADRKTGCKIWDAAPDPEEKITWSGKCEAGMAEGEGTLQFYVGDKPSVRYEGEMRNGRADGHGVNLEPDGARYEGEWRNNAADGHGVYTKDGARYEGTWAAGCLKQGTAELAVGVSRQSCGFK